MQETFQFDIVNANNQKYYFICQEKYDKQETYYFVKCSTGQPGQKQETFDMRINCDTGNFIIQHPDNLTPDVVALEQAISDKICAMHD